MTSVNDYKSAMTKRMTTTYESSHAYLSQTYASAKSQLTNSTTYLTDKYTAGQDFVTGSYQAGMDRYFRTICNHVFLSEALNLKLIGSIS